MHQPLNIVHLVRAPIGGIFRHIVDLALEQTERGHFVGIICDSDSGGDFEDELIGSLAGQLKYGVQRTPMKRAVGPFDLVSLFAIGRIVRDIRPDVIHAHGAKGGLFGRLVGSRQSSEKPGSIRRIYSPHGGSLHYSPRSLEGRLYFAIERLLQRRTDAVVHVSHYERRTYIEKVGQHRCPAHVVHNGLRPLEFEPVSPDSAAGDFFYMGVLRDLKGVDVFLHALALVRARGWNGTATVLGNGEPSDKARYVALTEQLGIADRVRFLDPLPTREAFLRGRCLVVPSRAESLPYVVLEATAAAIPVLATGVGGIPEIITDTGPLQLLAPGDAAALAERMLWFLEQPEVFAAAAALQRDAMREAFSLDTMVSSVMDVYTRPGGRLSQPT